MKRVVYIHQYFKTPDEGGAIRSYYIAKEMVNRGIQTEMITSHNKAKYEFRQIEGINVHYLPVSYSYAFSFHKRVISFLKFAFATIRLLKNIPTADLIYATSTPLTVGIVALWMKWTKGIRYFFEVRDLWPEAPIQLGILNNKLLKYLAVTFEKIVYKNAFRIIALSPGIQHGILVKNPAAQTHVIPNMADLDFFQQKMAKTKIHHNLTIGYFGAFGLTNNTNFLLDLAIECQKSNLPVSFLFAGAGMKKKDIEQHVIDLGLKNVSFYQHKNRYEIRILMNEVDACITSFLKTPVLETNSPNKFFDGLAAGKLCIVNTKGWLKNLVEKNRCGLFIDPEEVSTFPELILPFIKDQTLLET